MHQVAVAAGCSVRVLFDEHDTALVTRIIVNPALPVPDSNDVRQVAGFSRTVAQKAAGIRDEGLNEGGGRVVCRRSGPETGKSLSRYVVMSLCVTSLRRYVVIP